jgi:hypothetical protein
MNATHLRPRTGDLAADVAKGLELVDNNVRGTVKRLHDGLPPRVFISIAGAENLGMSWPEIAYAQYLATLAIPSNRQLLVTMARQNPRASLAELFLAAARGGLRLVESDGRSELMVAPVLYGRQGDLPRCFMEPLISQTVFCDNHWRYDVPLRLDAARWQQVHVSERGGLREQGIYDLTALDHDVLEKLRDDLARHLAAAALHPDVQDLLAASGERHPARELFDDVAAILAGRRAEAAAIAAVLEAPPGSWVGARAAPVDSALITEAARRVPARRA